MERFHVITWESDGRGGWENPELIGHASDLGEAEQIYREVLEEWGRRDPEGYRRVEIVQAPRHRDYRPDKPG